MFELGQTQEFVDQRLQAFALRLHVGDKTATFGSRQVGLGEQFGGAANRCQRAFHFVRQMLDVVFDVSPAIDLVAQLGEGSRQFADFVVATRWRLGGAAGGEQACVTHQTAHREGQPGGKCAADQ